ncbi:hypothetical protein [Phenylobacterium sp.]|uniref:hypothetical protein n=1 Tax=Phenylobacterium sp. TaxID=1871053 RepID=UPI002C5BE50D|nr:hypothetical protein [Phenylobacterium sp.]HVI30477.1 hypothetical protein [Phenylobacterium sp.]
MKQGPSFSAFGGPLGFSPGPNLIEQPICGPWPFMPRASPSNIPNRPVAPWGVGGGSGAFAAATAA